MKNSAVDWLVEKLKSQGLLIGEIDNLVAVKQAKEMEKEQMCGFAEFVATYSDKNQNYLGDMLHAKSKYDGAERTIDLLEQYYKENNKSE